MTKAPGDKDFASAVMMRLVAAGLAQQGLQGLLKPAQGAHVPRLSKQAFLEKIAQEKGPQALLKLADAVPAMPPEPVVQALRKATDLADLFDRWRRVEVFSHASHVVVAKPQGANAYSLQHTGRSAAQQPTREETLLVMGVLTILGEVVCDAPLDLTSSTGVALRKNGTWQEVTGAEPFGAFVLGGNNAVADTAKPAPPPEPDVIEASKRILREDLLRRWSLRDLAQETRTSTRSLQRQYAQKSTSFTGLVAEARLEAAAAHLCAKDGPSLAEIGFLSGYTDQSHFSREFAARVGTTPRAFRQSFSA